MIPGTPNPPKSDPPNGRHPILTLGTAPKSTGTHSSGARIHPTSKERLPFIESLVCLEETMFDSPSGPYASTYPPLFHDIEHRLCSTRFRDHSILNFPTPDSPRPARDSPMWASPPRT
ncbi:hypothetical protein M404DRAFT_845548 [Pisolithus tinctorius Marx 270]|uniref:Uncharacterized protein n=1 Tax=Pisolithus tinctorius Marx 270 TaxID=870435 RepID=A0A0C3NTS3_PISTI|nr:hypothetical protein M404DRAFT_845548 [Pisolithus tinctorius Marx 270]